MLITTKKIQFNLKQFAEENKCDLELLSLQLKKKKYSFSFKRTILLSFINYKKITNYLLGFIKSIKNAESPQKLKINLKTIRNELYNEQCDLNKLNASLNDIIQLQALEKDTVQIKEKYKNANIENLLKNNIDYKDKIHKKQELNKLLSNFNEQNSLSSKIGILKSKISEKIVIIKAKELAINNLIIEELKLPPEPEKKKLIAIPNFKTKKSIIESNSHKKEKKLSANQKFKKRSRYKIKKRNPLKNYKKSNNISNFPYGASGNYSKLIYG